MGEISSLKIIRKGTFPDASLFENGSNTTPVAGVTGQADIPMVHAGQVGDDQPGVHRCMISTPGQTAAILSTTSRR